MKNTGIWKIILFTIITGGLYSLVWIGKTRDYIVKNYKDVDTIPRWLWLMLIPIVYILGFFSILGVSLAAYLDAVSVDVVINTMNVAVIFMILLSLLVGIWWFWHFGKAMEVVLQGRVPWVVSIVLFVVLGPFLPALYQYYINHLDQNKKGESYRASPGLVTFVLIFSFLYVLGAVSSIYSYIQGIDMTKREITAAQVNMKEMKSLEEKYNSCTIALNAEYPGEYINDTDAEAYNKALEGCSKLYSDYEAAYDKYVDNLQ